MWLGYAFTILLEIAVTAILIALLPVLPIARFPIPYVLLTMIVAYYFGIGPALLSVVLGWATFTHFFVEPSGFWPIATTRLGWARQIAFLLGVTVVAIAAAQASRSQKRLAARTAQLEKEARERQRAEGELQSFVVSMADGLVAWDAGRRLILMNEVGRRITGMPPNVPAEALSGNYELQDLDGDPLPLSEWPSERALKGEVTSDVRARLVTPWRQTIISLSAAPVRAANGQIVGATSVFRDASEQVAAERLKEEAYEREHRIATMLQRALVPPLTNVEFDTCSLSMTYEPALSEAEVGGDFYDVFELSGTKIGVVIGDVAGKGLASAAHVAAIKHAIRSYAYLFDDPAQVLAFANESVCKFGTSEEAETQMVTAFYLVVDSDNAVVRYANAGHEPPFLIRRSGGIEQLDDASGIVAGVFCGAAFQTASRQFADGDVILMFTDGISEARTNSTNLFGSRGILQFLAEHPDLPLSKLPTALVESARRHAGGRLKDDAAVVAVCCKC